MSKIKGALAICKYLGCTESTFMARVINEDLPAKKVHGEYTSTTAKLDKWLGAKSKAETEAAKETAEAEAKDAEAKAIEERAEADAAEAQAAEENAEAEAAEKKAAAAKAKVAANKNKK